MPCAFLNFPRILSEERFNTVMQSTTARVPTNFVVGQIYRRRLLHQEYGGQRQGGISTPRNHPFIFLFTGESGQQYGYQDGYQESSGVFLYTGEGQIGPMQWIRGNQAIRTHQENGKELHLFETAGRGEVRYLGQATFLISRIRAAPDRTGSSRDAIVFELDVDTNSRGGSDPSRPLTPLLSIDRFWREPLSALRARALQTLPTGSPPIERKRNVYQRSQAVKIYVLKRSKGICEACNQPAPFNRPSGKYYLEPHHIRRVADAGPDHPRWVAALCPNCHRRVHHGEDGDQLNRRLEARIGELEEVVSAPGVSDE